MCKHKCIIPVSPLLKVEWYIQNHISLDTIITKRSKIGMVDYKNHISLDDIITKRGESGMVDYVFRGLKPQS